MKKTKKKTQSKKEKKQNYKGNQYTGLLFLIGTILFSIIVYYLG